jgi:hypothetical protein
MHTSYSTSSFSIPEKALLENWIKFPNYLLKPKSHCAKDDFHIHKPSTKHYIESKHQSLY